MDALWPVGRACLSPRLGRRNRLPYRSPNNQFMLNSNNLDLTPRPSELYPASVKFLFSFLVSIASLALAQTEPQNPFKNDAQAPEAGRGIFRIRCAPCH